MEDLKELSLCLKLGEIPSVEMRLNEKFNFLYYMLIQTIQGEITPKHRRFVVINAELLLLDDALITTYSEEKEREVLKQQLNDESNTLRDEINSQNTRKNAELYELTTFDTKLTIIKSLN